MQMTSINAKSTKDAIITAAEEIISDRESKLTTLTAKTKDLVEERNTVLILLAAISAYSILF